MSWSVCVLCALTFVFLKPLLFDLIRELPLLAVMKAEHLVTFHADFYMVETELTKTGDVCV